jgi:adenylate kinase family enzyme
MNSPDKHQYDPSEVITSGFDYVDSVDVNQINNATSRSVRETEIKNLINDEIIREYNIHNYVTHLEYSKYERAITSTFKYVHNRLEEQKKDRNMKVIYIQGESSAGKSTYAKKMAEDKNMSYYVSSSSNDVLDSYKGQDCLILDDLRSDSMTFSDLLKMLDNNTSSSVKSRFKNKSLIYCKLVIITTTQPLDDFIEKLPKSTTEDSTQLKRRIGALVYLTKQHMSIYSYDEVQKRHLLTVEGLENPILKLLKEKEINQEKELNSFLDLLGVDPREAKEKNNNTRKLFA